MNKNAPYHALLRYLAILVWALWMGGFAFYFGIVVPTGGAIVGGTQQGIVTQQVTFWLNVIGCVALPVLLFNTIRTKRSFLLGSWVVMAICQAALFYFHWRLDTLIDASAMSVSDASTFSELHETYEAISTVMWMAAMVHAWSFVNNPAAQAAKNA